MKLLKKDPGKAFSTNRILNSLMPELNLPIEKKDVIESSAAGFGGGVTVATPVAGIQQLATRSPDVTTEGGRATGRRSNAG